MDSTASWANTAETRASMAKDRKAIRGLYLISRSGRVGGHERVAKGNKTRESRAKHDHTGQSLSHRPSPISAREGFLLVASPPEALMLAKPSRHC